MTSLDREEVSARVEDVAATTPEARESAAGAGLRYVTDASRGIARKRRGAGFSYVDWNGAPIRDASILGRVRSLAIPPAWTNVWICPHANGHIQATGRDARGRKQYRYHPRWRLVRDETKYERMLAFGEALPKIRHAVLGHLGTRGLSREKLLATVVSLLELTCIRVGNEEYARTNHSFGLTTLHDRHVDIHGSRLCFHFRGKSGKMHEVDVRDARLARIVRQCSELPGHELFQYVDESGEPRAIESADVNEYLREVSGGDFTAKDFRTWAGTLIAARELAERKCGGSARETKKIIASAIERVSERLGNTPAICRKSYVHPAVIEAFTAGLLVGGLLEHEAEEVALMNLLRRSPS